MRALDNLVVFKVLLDGGHICAKHPATGAAKYTVHTASFRLGHITEKQFEQLVSHKIIAELPKRSTDKSGNVYRYWKLEGGE